jgi:hypothetical protein
METSLFANFDSSSLLLMSCISFEIDPKAVLSLRKEVYSSEVGGVDSNSVSFSLSIPIETYLTGVYLCTELAEYLEYLRRDLLKRAIYDVFGQEVDKHLQLFHY